MSQVMQVHTKVLPGKRIEVISPDLSVGQDVEVTISTSQPKPMREHAIDILDSLTRARLFQTPEEADAYLKIERESWDR